MFIESGYVGLLELMDTVIVGTILIGWIISRIKQGNEIFMCLKE